MEKYFVCQVCGHIALGAAPAACPVCDSNDFAEDEKAIMPAAKEGKEKHVPVIKVLSDCGLIPKVCRDAHVLVGSTIHPMTPDHWIQWIDVYLNKVFVSRYMLYPQSLQPGVGLHLKSDQKGTLTVIEHCSKHGSWMAETEL